MSGLTSIIFAQAWVLLLLPLLSLFWYWRKRRAYYPDLELSSTAGLGPAKSWRSRLRPILPRLQLFVLGSLILALARPQKVLVKENIKADGIDIVVALDVSSSMLARDFKEDRLDASKRVVQRFVDQRPYDRLGLVLFAGRSYTQCPLTTDHGMLKQLISRVECGLIEEGTAIGMGLANAVRRLQKSQVKSKVIILLTDGVNNSGKIPPLVAVEAAKKLGIKVYTIGVGTRGRALAPIYRKANGSFVFSPTEVEIDEKLLQQIAESTKGLYFRATDEKSLEKIYAQIDKLERSKIEKETFIRHRELYQYFLFFAVILLFLHLILQQTVLRSIVQ